MPYKSKETAREYQRQWARKRRSDFFADKSCTKCGSTQDLELDHINPATKTEHKIWSWAKERRETELLKCQVLCKVCHQAKTGTENRVRFTLPIQHGTYAGYKHKGCRCAACLAAYSKYRKEYYQRTGN